MVPHTLIEAQASRIAGTTVTVQCQTVAQMNMVVPDTASYLIWGYVNFDENGVAFPVIYLRQRACDDLSHLNEKHNPNLQLNNWDATNPNDIGYGPMADLEDGEALEALVHEAMHVRWGQNESTVECAAYRYRHQAVLGWGIAKWKQDRLYWGMKMAHAETLADYRGVC